MKKVSFLFVFFTFIIFSLIFIQKKEKEKTVTINFVGDIIPHKVIKHVSLKQNKLAVYKKRYKYVRKYLTNANLSVCNLETPIADTNLIKTNKIIFDAPIEFAQSLHFAGFNLLNIANNHAFDCGLTGFKQTIENLLNNDFKIVGYSIKNEIQTFVYRTNNIKIGFLSATKLLNFELTEGKENTNITFYITNEIFKAIKKLKQKTDYVIFIIHWGKEYIIRQPQLKNEAIKIFNAGADAIIGHHPHILLPIKIMDINGKLHIVAYSLGNFLSNQGRKFPADKSKDSEHTRQSVILQIKIGKNKNSIYLKSMKITPVWIVNNFIEVEKKISKTRKIFPIPLDLNNTNIMSLSKQLKERHNIFKILHINDIILKK